MTDGFWNGLAFRFAGFHRLAIAIPPRSILYWLCVCAGLSASACNPLVNFFAFHPDTGYSLSPEVLPVDTKAVFFEAEDGVRIQALHLRDTASKNITIFLHGNAGNIYHRLVDFRRLRKLGTSVLAVSYRGYAKSEGSPSEDGIYRDARAAFGYATGTLGYPTARIFVFGRSIGSAAAVDLAQDRDIAGLILASPLSSALDQAKAMGLGFAAPLIGNAFDNVAKIKSLKAPLLVIHGSNDRIIPIGMGRDVYEAAAGEKFFHEIKGAGHNDLSHRFARDYWGTVLAFFEHVAKKR